MLSRRGSDLKSIKVSMGKTVRKLTVLSPVPADIDIANSVEALPIQDIAEDLGLSPDDYSLYGKSKAKVCFVSEDSRHHVFQQSRGLVV